MTTTDKIILTVILAAVATIFAIGAEKAYGQFEEVPFDYQNSGCVLVENTIDYKRYECYADWRSEDYKEPGEEKTPAEDGCMAGYDIDITTGQCKPHEIIEAEAIAECEADPSCPRGLYIPPAEPTFWEKELDKVDDREDSYSKDELIRLINEMLDNPAQCYQGIGTTAGSQQERSFDIPTYEYTDENGKTRLVLDTRTEITDRNLRGILGQIVKDSRECAAQIVLLNPQGGIMSEVDSNFAYCDDLPNDTVEYNPFCGKNYFDHSVVAQNVPIWSQQRVNEEANREDNPNAWSILEDICHGYYTQTWKDTFEECQIDYTEQYGFGFAAKKPTMKYYDDALFQDYRDYGDENQKQKILEEKLHEKIQQAYREYHAFSNQ